MKVIKNPSKLLFWHHVRWSEPLTDGTPVAGSWRLPDDPDPEDAAKFYAKAEEVGGVVVDAPEGTK